MIQRGFAAASKAMLLLKDHLKGRKDMEYPMSPLIQF
jgi:hypothetical protein